MLKLKINLTFHKDKEHKRKEIFNLRNETALKRFKDLTTNTNRFSKCFVTQETLDVQFKRWQRQLQKALHVNFKKVRCKDEDDPKLSKIDILMEEKKIILNKKHLSAEDKNAIKIVDARISKECEEGEWEKLQQTLGGLDTSEGNTNIWLQMKKAFPKKVQPLPTGVKNFEGKVITNPNKKDTVILNKFVHRMRKRPIKKEVEELHEINEELLKKRLRLATSVKSSQFSMQELEST